MTRVLLDAGAIPLGSAGEQVAARSSRAAGRSVTCSPGQLEGRTAAGAAPAHGMRAETPRPRRARGYRRLLSYAAPLPARLGGHRRRDAAEHGALAAAAVAAQGAGRPRAGRRARCTARLARWSSACRGPTTPRGLLGLGRRWPACSSSPSTAPSRSCSRCSGRASGGAWSTTSRATSSPACSAVAARARQRIRSATRWAASPSMPGACTPSSTRCCSRPAMRWSPPS